MHRGPMTVLLAVAIGTSAWCVPAFATPPLDEVRAVHLHVPRLGAALARRATTMALAQTSPEPSAAPIEARASSTATATPLPAAAFSSGAPSAAPDGDAADDRRFDELLRQRRRVQSIHRRLGITTWAALIGTALTGTLDSINQPTAFGHGLCISGPNAGILGNYGCANLGMLNTLGTFITSALYTATATYAINMLNLDRVAGGSSGRSRVALTMHRGIVYVHLIAMILQPLLVVFIEHPEILGVSPTQIVDATAALRTVHQGVEFVSVGSLTTAMILEL